MKTSRRTFVATAATLGITAATPSFGQVQQQRHLVHHVYFWLKRKDSKEDLNRLIEGLNTLRQIKELKLAKIGLPAATEKRDVVDNSYSVSWLNFFDNLEGQNAYQVHPIHLKFIDDCKHLWDKVVVYDSMDI